jgi:D-arabinose 1-dehydrogenase-like Zn-dependent alcohol dehydrogenase
MFFFVVVGKDCDTKPELPRIPGHEDIGEIIELVSAVDNHLK